jgi:hypothetical protein
MEAKYFHETNRSSKPMCKLKQYGEDIMATAATDFVQKKERIKKITTQTKKLTSVCSNLM